MLSLAVYSWASEKFAWLVMHPLLPLILLAGVGVQAIWEARARLARQGGARASPSLALAYRATRRCRQRRARAPTRASSSSPRSPRRRSSGSPTRSRRWPSAAARRRCKITVDSAEGATFPWAWYFRHLDVGYLDLRTAGAAPSDTDVVILTEASRTPAASRA